ncbi:hypothetical protein, partial [Paraburkholderia piptadeniae]|uniref:hypothetical protein n=1 Tax=Paraburkholderia piptadeniae TaxID=1701573 RepID=UPI00135AC6A1
MATFTMNEASNLFIGVDEESPPFWAAAPVPMLTHSLQDRYLFQRSVANIVRVSHTGSIVTLPNAKQVRGFFASVDLRRAGLSEWLLDRIACCIRAHET